jgi:molybdate-binding protein
MAAECLASCGTAPVLQVNDEFVEEITLEMADALIEEWNRELGVVSQMNSPDSASSDGQAGSTKDFEPKTEIKL